MAHYVDLFDYSDEPDSVDSVLSALSVDGQLQTIRQFLGHFENLHEEQIKLAQHVVHFAAEHHLLDRISTNSQDRTRLHEVEDEIRRWQTRWEESRKQQEGQRKKAGYLQRIRKNPGWGAFPDCIPEYMRTTKSGCVKPFGNTVLVHWGALAEISQSHCEAVQYLAQRCRGGRIQDKLLKRAIAHFQSRSSDEDQCSSLDSEPISNVTPSPDELAATILMDPSTIEKEWSPSDQLCQNGNFGWQFHSQSFYTPPVTRTQGVPAVSYRGAAAACKANQLAGRSRALVRDKELAPSTPHALHSTDRPESPEVEHGRGYGDEPQFFIDDRSEVFQFSESSSEQSIILQGPDYDRAASPDIQETETVRGYSDARWLPSFVAPTETSAPEDISVARLSRDFKKLLDTPDLAEALSHIIGIAEAHVMEKRRLIRESKQVLESIRIEEQQQAAAVRGYNSALQKCKNRTADATTEYESLLSTIRSTSHSSATQRQGSWVDVLAHHLKAAEEKMSMAKSEEVEYEQKLEKLDIKAQEIIGTKNRIRNNMEKVEGGFSRSNIPTTIHDLAMKSANLVNEAHDCWRSGLLDIDN